ncbi:PREDICTED: probable glucuronosyltransferase Os01g0926700 [Erythranthe guttata]|nr:PREDICTED: probable glucuronosyltransferase Os01g0926700 [Erythranthe guttata]|eukprot:XP_012848002.1 PREDICTED: probable glucuronosyltransferase Os01g0926700 [Erythranthe guttata]
MVFGVRALLLLLSLFLGNYGVEGIGHASVRTERISGSAGDVLEDNPVGKLKVYVYELPSKYNKKILQKDPRCLEEKAVKRGILPLLKRATLVQTFGQRNHVCLNEGSITIPPYAPPEKMQSHLIPPDTPRSIFVYFRGLFYDVNNDPEGGYYARGARASIWENFKNNPLFDISTDHPTTYYEDMQRSVFCLCPLGWAPWSPRLVEAVIFGCIPVIIADDIVLPFADAIPWEQIGVFVAEKDVPYLDTVLTSIPVEVILRKQRLLANPSMKQAMLFPQPAQSGDAFHQILNGLARKLPHEGRIFLKPGEKILNWTAGPIGDLKPW